MHTRKVRKLKLDRPHEGGGVQWGETTALEFIAHCQMNALLLLFISSRFCCERCQLYHNMIIMTLITLISIKFLKMIQKIKHN